MPFSTYAELRDSVVKYAFRAGDTEFEDSVPDFIVLAESRFNRKLRLREMEERATLALTNGAAALPADYLEYRSVEANVFPSSSLELVTPDFVAAVYGAPCSGRPRHFTIIGQTLKVYPSTSMTVALDYYAKIPALSGTAPTNWLLAKAPEVYLYGALLESAPFMMDDDRLGAWGRLLDQAMADLRSADTGARYARSRARVWSDTP